MSKQRSQILKAVWGFFAYFAVVLAAIAPVAGFGSKLDTNTLTSVQIAAERRKRRGELVRLNSESKPALIPDRLVAERYDVCVRTLERWDATPGLGFPPPIRIRRRRFRESAALDAWDRANARKVAASPNPSQAVARTLPRAKRGRFRKPQDIEAR
jgi:hypothetical protein